MEKKDEFVYFSIPLEQGLRPPIGWNLPTKNMYFSIPLEQGLRQTDKF